MQTIIELLHEIRWNPNLKPEEHLIGYYDRVAKSLKWVRFNDIDFERGDNFSFIVVGENGRECNIPFHRVRQVTRREEVIWQRRMEDIHQETGYDNGPGS